MNSLPSAVLCLVCPNCKRLHAKLDRMSIIDIKRNWEEIEFQRKLVNASDFNLCCDDHLEYFIGGKLAETVLFRKKDGNK